MQSLTMEFKLHSIYFYSLTPKFKKLKRKKKRKNEKQKISLIAFPKKCYSKSQFSQIHHIIRGGLTYVLLGVVTLVEPRSTSKTHENFGSAAPLSKIRMKILDPPQKPP